MKHNYFILLIALAFISACRQQPRTKVDLLITNATIYMCDSAFGTAEAMAVDKGKIIATGTTRDLQKKYVAATTEDLQGKAVYPGFIDAHSHLLGYGKMLNQADLTGTHTFDEVIERVKTFAMQSNADWITGRGWNETLWEPKTMPNKTKLDFLFPDRPVCLSRVDGHAVLVNQAALDLAGINENTKIEGGKIEKIGGYLSGVLVDAAADKMKALIPALPIDEMKKSILAAQKKCLAAGLTGVTDAGLSLDELKAYMELEKEGKLVLRVYAMMNPDEENFRYFDSSGPIITPHLTIRSVKLYADGALGSHGALLKKPYCDDSTTFGLNQHSEAWFKNMCSRLFEKGWQVNTHCIGDSANAYILKTYAGLLKKGNNLRWRIEHAQVVDLADRHYFGDYAILPSVQPTHATSDMNMAEKRLCSTRMPEAYAYKSLLKVAGILPLGTDFPVEDIDPLATYFSAVYRQNTQGQPAEGFLKNEALTMEETLRGMTIWAAYAGFYDQLTGSLVPGKQADFTVLSSDLKYASLRNQVAVESVWVDGVKRN